jgi:hypothetical protein
MRINQKRLVGSGNSILFWYDIWFGEVPFYILFPNLFAKAKSLVLITLAQVWNNGNIKIPLTRGASLLLCRKKTEVILIITLSANFLSHYHPSGLKAHPDSTRVSGSLSSQECQLIQLLSIGDILILSESIYL